MAKEIKPELLYSVELLKSVRVGRAVVSPSDTQPQINGAALSAIIAADPDAVKSFKAV